MRYLDAGLFHFQAESDPMPKEFNKTGRTNPLAWAFYSDAKYYNAFSKLIRYESALQREYSRALRDLDIIQNNRRARQAEAAEDDPNQPETPPVPPESEKTNRTQFPEPRNTPDGGWVRDAPQDPDGNPSSGGS